jgi:uncharacterized protein with GYD domain
MRITQTQSLLLNRKLYNGFIPANIEEKMIFSDIRRYSVAKYLFYGSYSPEGYQGLMKEGGSVRIDVSKQALASVNGSLEAFYYSNGEQDFYIIVNLPDHIASTAVTLVGNASGSFRIRAVQLLTPDEMDQAVRQQVDFRPPGH